MLMAQENPGMRISIGDLKYNYLRGRTKDKGIPPILPVRQHDPMLCWNRQACTRSSVVSWEVGASLAQGHICTLA